MKPYVFPTRFSRGGWVVALEDPRGNALSFNSFPSRRIIFSGRRVFTEVPEFFFPLYILFANETSYKIFPPLFFTVLSVINASRIFEIEIIFLARMEIIDKFWTIEINSVRLEFLNDLCGRRTARKRWKIGEREREIERRNTCGCLFSRPILPGLMGQRFIRWVMSRKFRAIFRFNQFIIHKFDFQARNLRLGIAVAEKKLGK